MAQMNQIQWDQNRYFQKGKHLDCLQYVYTHNRDWQDQFECTHTLRPQAKYNIWIPLKVKFGSKEGIKL